MIENPSPSQMTAADVIAQQSVNPNQLKFMEEIYRLTRQFRSGADWFFWIAALSVINTVISIAGGNLNFVVGLGATQVIDGFAQGIMEEMSSANGILLVRVISIILDLGILGLFVFFGIFARKGHRWAFIIGMVLYFFDSLIFLLVPDFFSIGFHAFALFGLFSGLAALGKLKKIQQAMQQPSVISPA